MAESQYIPDCCALVLPVFNEEARIVSTLEYYSYLEKKIYIIDNFSTDNTIKLANNFNVEVLKYANSGTIETPEWTLWLLNALNYQYFLFLSCSEELSGNALSSISSLVQKKIELCYWRRISFTNNEESLIFDSLTDLLTFRRSGQYTCRFASRIALKDNYLKIKIHDNFKSFRKYCLYIEDSNHPNLIKHCRPATDFNVLKKLLYYAKAESADALSSRSRTFFVSNFYLIRCMRELLYMILLFLSFRLTQTRANELLARIILHLQIYILITRNNIS